MYKIRYYFLMLTLLSIHPSVGQRPQVVQVRIDPPETSLPKVNPSVRRAGPLADYSDRREVKRWVQIEKAAKVQIRYHQSGKPTPAYLTNEVYTNRQTVFTVHLLADKVEPKKKHAYEVLVADRKVSLPYPTPFQTQSLWQWQTDPLAFHFAVGSCTYVNEPDADRPDKSYGL